MVSDWGRSGEGGASVLISLCNKRHHYRKNPEPIIIISIIDLLRWVEPTIRYARVRFTFHLNIIAAKHRGLQCL